MADAANKYPENVDGKFYVDDQCIDCDLCRETAPANFRRNDDGGHSYVYKQPESPEEEALCKETMEGCPGEAIGSDGAQIYSGGLSNQGFCGPLQKPAVRTDPVRPRSPPCPVAKN